MMKGKANLSFCNNAGSLSRTDCCISWTILLGRRRDGGRMNKVAFISHLSVIQPQNMNSCLCFWVLYMWEQMASSVPQTSASRRKTQGAERIGTWDQHAGFVFELVGAYIEQAPEAVARTSNRLMLSCVI